MEAFMNSQEKTSQLRREFAELMRQETVRMKEEHRKLMRKFAFVYLPLLLLAFASLHFLDKWGDAQLEEMRIKAEVERGQK
jgi:hypothetical protein